jgi:hypothetical protein
VKPKILAFVFIASIVLLAVGCGPTPTRTPAVTQAPQIITVIVTAEPPPATETPAQIAPTPQLSAAITLSAPVTITTATTPAIKAPVVAAKPTATKKPVVAAATATATAMPLKFAAPSLLRPNWTDSQKDERKNTDSVEFVWRPTDGMAPGECYLLTVTSESTNPVPVLGTKSDYFLVRCADQPRTDDEIKFGEVRFTLYSPKIGCPNYTSVMLDTNEMWINWSITVVKNLGQCDAGNSYHCKTQALSPPGKARFLFKIVS